MKKALLGLILFFAFHLRAEAAIAHDCVFYKTFSSQASPASFVSSSGTVSCTPAATANRVLICYGQLRSISFTAPAMTWNGVSLTQIGSTIDGVSMHQVQFGLINPASGAQTISFSWSGGDTASGMVLSCIMINGADQSTGWQNATSAGPTTNTSATITVTSANGNMAVSGACFNNGSVPTLSAGTSEYIDGSVDGNYAAARVASSGASSTMTWSNSSVEWIVHGVDVIAFGGSSFKPYSLPITGVGQ